MPRIMNYRGYVADKFYHWLGGPPDDVNVVYHPDDTRHQRYRSAMARQKALYESLRVREDP